MLLRVPTSINTPIWEDVLEEEQQQNESEIRLARPPQTRAENLPIVSIGQPEVWNLLTLYDTDQIPRWLQAKLEECKFFLIRLSCSFRPRRSEFQISEANFSIELLPDKQQNQAIAFDVHPLEVNQEIKRNLKVMLTPSLKFKEVQASLVSTEFGLEYEELQPMIVATGVGESKPSWEYHKAQGKGIQGSKFMHLLLRVPNNMDRVMAKLKLTARLEEKSKFLSQLFLINRNSNNQDSDCLLIQLI